MAGDMLLVTDDRLRSADLAAALPPGFACDTVDLDGAPAASGVAYRAVIFDIDLSNAEAARKVRAMLPRTAKDRIARVFLAERSSHHARIQAAAFGSAAVVNRPLDPAKLYVALFGPPKDPSPVVPSAKISSAAETASGATTAVFDALRYDAPLDLSALHEQEEQIDEALIDGEISEWIAAVREHHSYTYRHCNLVAGVTAAFSRRLGIGTRDRQRLLRGALLHDIGKAGIPVAILDKPGELTEGERIVMRSHPNLGRDFLRKHHRTEAELIEIVYAHHEVLDGSGYPRGLKAQEIQDAVRIVTICDIFAALIETRPYRKASSRQEAYHIMENMQGKLDADLMRAFKSVALGV